VVTAGRTAPASSWPGSTHGRCGKLHGVLEEGLGGWDITGSWQKKGPGRWLAMAGGGAQLGVRAAMRTAGEPRPLIRRSCLGEGVTTSARGDHRSQGMGGGAPTTCVRAAGYGGDAVGGSTQVGFARPVSMWRLAT
jgi:hypothetical protein